ncbi:MAG TPA: methyl-accepting chemotaxis protein [Polyangiaceae bacterium]|nr:methyl-accepting chemotaxis protein [Polyangiaceae bacterium]
MLRTLTARCGLAFLLLEILFAPLVVVAFEQLIGIDGYAPAHWLLASAAILKALLWGPFLTLQLKPYERFARLPVAARSPSVVSQADQALQAISYRFGSFYAASWVIAYAVVTATLLVLGVGHLPTGPRVVEAVLLLLGGLGFGSFAFGFPLIGMLSANAASECGAFASKHGILLERTPKSLQARIGVVSIALALGPTLWMTALGYMKQVQSNQEQRTLSAELANARLSAQVQDSLTRDRPRAALEPLVQAASRAPLKSFVLAPDGAAIAAEGEEDAFERDQELRDWARTHKARGNFVLSRLDLPRVAALERLATGHAVLTVLDAPVSVPRGFGLSAAIFVLVVGIWAPVCALILSRAISGPIERLTRAASLVVEEGELSKMGSLPVEQSDEVGVLTEKFNDLMNLMRGLSQAAQGIATGDLRVEIAGTGELPDAFRSMLVGLRDIVAQIGETSVDLASAAAEIFAASQEQESAAASQSSAMVEISRTMDSLSNSAAHVSDAVQGVLSNAERTLKNTDEMVQRIGQLSSHAGRIGEILEVIRDIADKSDLLALNGSLEASRAGEGGRGFALVAGEMRRLAERVTASVQDVKKLVYDIRESGSSTVMATEESRKLAEGTTEAARQITFVTQQQRSGTEQVSQSVKNIADVVAQAVSATSQTRTSAQSLKTRADTLSSIVRQFRVIEPKIA